MKDKLRKIGNTKRNKLVNETLKMIRQELQTYLNINGLLRTK